MHINWKAKSSRLQSAKVEGTRGVYVPRRSPPRVPSTAPLGTPSLPHVAQKETPPLPATLGLKKLCPVKAPLQHKQSALSTVSLQQQPGAYMGSPAVTSRVYSPLQLTTPLSAYPAPQQAVASMGTTTTPPNMALNSKLLYQSQAQHPSTMTSPQKRESGGRRLSHTSLLHQQQTKQAAPKHELSSQSFNYAPSRHEKAFSPMALTSSSNHSLAAIAEGGGGELGVLQGRGRNEPVVGRRRGEPTVTPGGESPFPRLGGAIRRMQAPLYGVARRQSEGVLRASWVSADNMAAASEPPIDQLKTTPIASVHSLAFVGQQSLANHLSQQQPRNYEQKGVIESRQEAIRAAKGRRTGGRTVSRSLQSLSGGRISSATSPFGSSILHRDASEQDVELDLPLPPNWEMEVTNDGYRYYVDHNNQRTHWIHPLAPEQLAPGWVKIFDTHHGVVYYNESEQRSQFEHPGYADSLPMYERGEHHSNSEMRPTEVSRGRSLTANYQAPSVPDTSTLTPLKGKQSLQEDALRIIDSDGVPEWIRLYSQAPFNSDHLLDWRMFPLEQLEQIDRMLMKLFKQDAIDVVIRYERPRREISQELLSRE